jgi:hypothetical protein
MLIYCFRAIANVRLPLQFALRGGELSFVLAVCLSSIAAGQQAADHATSTMSAFAKIL